jgi:NACalpha-BTF3-like transcription factor
MDMLRKGEVAEDEDEDEDELSEEDALALLKEAGGNKNKARKLLAEMKKKGKK